MSWKFWKKPKSNDEYEVKTSSVHFSTLYRWYCYDVGVENTNELDETLGLVPMSEDGADMEREDSERRLTQIANLMPFITTMSTINATVFVETQFKKLLRSTPGIDVFDEETVEKLTDAMFPMYQYLSVSALVSSFAAAVEIGLVDAAVVSMEQRDSSEME